MSSSATLHSQEKLPLGKKDLKNLAAEIELAEGNEVLSVVSCTQGGRWKSLRILARGNGNSAPAIIRGLAPGDILLHNHPCGNLSPSSADMHVASICGNSGIGFAIHNNECNKFYVVVEPFIEKPREKIDVEKLIQYVESDSPLTESITNFQKRPGQVRLLKEISRSFNESRHALIEGETGIGKTLAYLIPAIYYAHANKCRVAVSTNTINLQRQLVEKDLPAIAESVPFKFKYALVKGRSNFLCKRRFFEALEEPEGSFLLENEEYEQFRKITNWIEKTTDGSLTDLSWIVKPSLWDKICSDKDSCTGVSCREYDFCFFYNSRRKATQSDIMVVNHHLLFTDLALRASMDEYNQTAIIPAYDAVIMDEAHNIEETATKHFGFKTTLMGFVRLAAKIYLKKGRYENGVLAKLYSCISNGRGDLTDSERAEFLEKISHSLIPLRTNLELKGRNFFDALTDFYINRNRAYNGEHRLRIGNLQRSKTEFDSLTKFSSDFKDEAKALARQLKSLFTNLYKEINEEDADYEYFELPFKELRAFSTRLEEISASISLMFEPDSEQSDSHVHFFSTLVRKPSFYPSFNSFPIDVSNQMKEYCYKKIPVVVMISGTLSTNGNFSFIKSRLGLDDNNLSKQPIEEQFASPFDYRNQARLFVPTDICEPGNKEYLQQALIPLKEIIFSSNGGVLVLFTSYMHLNHFYDNLAPSLEANGINTYRQGDMERHYLLEIFKEDGSGVLFATDSFREGVDIPGSALRNLVIMKLPFSTPDDPVLEARNELIRSSGGNPFTQLQIPSAILKLKQGFGRLIRKTSDYGTVWIMDKRIISKYYGKYFIDSLPDIPVLKGPHKALVSISKEFLSSF